jgi:hypothetical protein
MLQINPVAEAASGDENTQGSYDSGRGEEIEGTGRPKIRDSGPTRIMSDRLQRRSIAGRTFGIPICLLYHLKSTVITDPSGVACTARLLTAPASQEQAVPAMRLPSPHQIQRHSATIRSLEFYGRLLRSLTN